MSQEIITLSDDEIMDIIDVRMLRKTGVDEKGSPTMKVEQWPPKKVAALKEAMAKAYFPGRLPRESAIVGLAALQMAKGQPKGVKTDPPKVKHNPTPDSVTIRPGERAKRWQDDAGVFWATDSQVERLRRDGNYGEIREAPVDGLTDRERLLISTLNPTVLGPELVEAIQRVTGVEPCSKPKS